MPQPFLHAGEDGLVVARLEIDHPVRSEASLCQRRGEQVGAGEAPQHLAACAGGDPTGKQRCGSAIDRAVPAARHLMQRPESEAAARQA